VVPAGMNAGNLQSELFGLTFVLLLIIVVLVVLLIRMYTFLRRRSLGLNARNTSQQQPVEFVVSTFQEMVAKLKEKERELEELRTHAETRAEVYESYSENILQCVPSGMISFDTSRRIMTVNRAAAEILDVDAAELIGKPAEALGPVIASIISDPEASPRQRREATYETRGGVQRWLGFFTSSLRDREGRQIGTILGFSDLTEIKLLREKIELRERLTHLGEVSAGIAHELRNPMAVIAGYAQMLDARTPGDAPTKQAVRAIRKEIAGMNRVINEFLQFARPTELNAGAVDLADLLREVIPGALGDRDDVEVETDLAPRAFVRADETLLRQALFNLVRNAVEAMPGGGRIRIASRPRNDLVEITVSDTGPGIPEEIRHKIFIPFVTGKDDGTGLGLAIVHKIVVMHEGGITVDSDGGGTTFTLQLPRAEGDEG